MKIELSQTERNNLRFILNEFITAHKPQENIYHNDIDVAKKILEEIK